MLSGPKPQGASFDPRTAKVERLTPLWQCRSTAPGWSFGPSSRDCSTSKASAMACLPGDARSELPDADVSYYSCLQAALMHEASFIARHLLSAPTAQNSCCQTWTGLDLLAHVVYCLQLQACNLSHLLSCEQSLTMASQAYNLGSSSPALGCDRAFKQAPSARCTLRTSKRLQVCRAAQVGESEVQGHSNDASTVSVDKLEQKGAPEMQSQ